MNKSSSWTALRNSAFRRLWIAMLISGTCVAAHDSAATCLYADKTSVGESFQILRFRYRARSLRARVTGRIGPKFPVWSVHFTDSGINAGCGLENVAPQFVRSRPIVHQHGSQGYSLGQGPSKLRRTEGECAEVVTPKIAGKDYPSLSPS
jgi:hypothetical protein